METLVKQILPDIVGVGLVSRDDVMVVPTLERDAKVAATQYFSQVGGPVPVALWAMVRLGLDTMPHFFGVVGDDDAGKEIARQLTKEKVTAHLVHAPGIATSRSHVYLDVRDGSRTLANYAETLPPLAFTLEQETILSQARLLHLDGRDLPAALRAAEIVANAGGLISLDLGTMRPGREPLIADCDIVLASKKGGAGAFPDVADNPMEQVRRFLSQGIRIAGVTLGKDGVVIGEQSGDIFHLPAYDVGDAVDTCGAGDLFHGAFLWAYLRGETLYECADFAQAAVAVRIGHYGNFAGLPTLDAVAIFRRFYTK